MEQGKEQSMAEGPGPEFDLEELRKEIVDRLVFQPIGLLSAVLKALPNAAEEGRRVVEGPLQTAKFVSDMAAGVVKARYGAQLNEMEARFRGVRDAVEHTTYSVIKEARARVSDTIPGRQPGRQGKAGADRGEPGAEQGHEEAVAVGGIAGYERLTAAEVVARLDDLSDAALAEVEAFELAHRRRRTVLAKISKLREARA
jgi:hypothetical protein